MEAAENLHDLAQLPSNKFEALSGDRKGLYSILWVNKQWRRCFEWPQDTDGPDNVEITDYHLCRKVMNRTPIHPGEILADELEEIGMSGRALAHILEVPANRVYQIIAGKRAITADTALRLGQYFGMSADFWMNLQKIYELDKARQKVGEAIFHIPQRPQVEG